MRSCTIIGNHLPPLELSIAKDKLRQFAFAGVTHFYLFFGDDMTRQLLPYILKLKRVYPKIRIYLCYSSTPITPHTKFFLSKFKRILPNINEFPLCFRSYLAYDYITKKADFAYTYLRSNLSSLKKYVRLLETNECQHLALSISANNDL